MNKNRSPHLLLALGALVLLAGRLPGATRLDTHGEVRNVLRSSWADDDRTPDEIAAELAAIGAEAVPVLVGLVDGRTLPMVLGVQEEGAEGEELDVSDWWRGPDAFGPVAFEALGLLPASEVIPYLAANTSATAPLEERLVAARILGRVGSAEGLELLCTLSSSFSDYELQYRSVRRPFEQAIARVLTEDPRSVTRLRRKLDGLPHDVQTIVVDAIVAADRPESLRLLEALIEGQHGPNQRVLGAVADLGARFRWRLGDEPPELLQLYLHHEDPRVRRSAVAGLARLQDANAFGTLITLLQDDAPAVRRTSLWALRGMSNLPLEEEEVERWHAWLDGQEEWWRRGRSQLLAKLDSGDPAEVLEAVRTFSERPFFRHEIALLFADLLGREQSSVKLVTCDALRRLDSGAAVPALAEQLQDGDEEVRQAAWKALRELTGKDLPLDAEAWSAYVDG